VAACGGSAELSLDTQTVDGYRNREDARAAAEDHIRALAAEKSLDLCPGTCAASTSRCKAIVLDGDLAQAVRTFMHRDDDGDPSYGWLITGGSITVHCACVEQRRPNKPVPATARDPAAPAAAPEKPRRRASARSATARSTPARPAADRTTPERPRPTRRRSELGPGHAARNDPDMRSGQR
jgi:hypothetical protein